MFMVSLIIFAEVRRLKLSVPVGWRELTERQKGYRKKSGDATKLV
jgi:hypothetical protein